MEPLVFELEQSDVTLGDLLKIVCAMSGGAAKRLIQDGGVQVNGEVDLRRGRRLRAGDRVELEGHAILVASPATSPDGASGEEAG